MPCAVVISLMNITCFSILHLLSNLNSEVSEVRVLNDSISALLCIWRGFNSGIIFLIVMLCECMNIKHSLIHDSVVSHFSKLGKGVLNMSPDRPASSCNFSIEEQRRSPVGVFFHK